jgi:hypothetical protein
LAGIGFIYYQVRSLHNVERAWVLPEADEIGVPQKGGLATFNLKNWGKTPDRMNTAILKAVAVKDASELDVVDERSGSVLRELEGRPMGPTESLKLLMGAVAAEQLSAEDWDAIARQEKSLILYAEIHYSDIFSKKHLTKFCYQWLRASPMRGITESSGGNKYNQST